MKIPELNSIKSIERQYETGERPVLVTCSDKNAYICKYMRSSASAYKLASEFIGANMIDHWNIRSPKFAFVKIEPAHWANINTSHTSAVALGYIMLEKVADINNVTIQNIKKNARILEQAGAAEVVVEADATGAGLFARASQLLDCPELLREMGAKARALGHPEALEHIYHTLKSL